jgi:hypothetical protein
MERVNRNGTCLRFSMQAQSHPGIEDDFFRFRKFFKKSVAIY